MLRKTLKFKLLSIDGISPVDALLPTFTAFTSAFNFASRSGFRSGERNQFKLQSIIYQKIKQSLPSQLSIASITKAIEALKSQDSWSKRTGNVAQKAPHSKLQSIQLDRNRSFTFIPDKNLVTISTIQKRMKFSLKISQYHKDQMKNWRQRSADLCIHNKNVWIYIVFEKDDIQVTSTEKYIGVDRGVKHSLVTSNNLFLSGKDIQIIKKRYERLRSSLQKKGTKSAKRHLRRLSGEEKRFRADVNNCLSKTLISSLKAGDAIVLEDLTNIRKRKRFKGLNKILDGWNFYQLERFITYKANAKGIRIIKVNPAYTSQICSRCNYCDKENRKGSNFVCKACGFAINADLNASRNICRIGDGTYMVPSRAIVNKPNGTFGANVPDSVFAGESSRNKLLNLFRSS